MKKMGMLFEEALKTPKLTEGRPRKEAVKIMIKTIRVMLVPNNKQKTKLFQYANTARFAYNWALGREQENYKKRKRRLQRSISRRYEKNKKGVSYCKTSNIIKREKELLKLNHRLTNIRQNYLHQITSEVIKREPSFICMEDLNVKGMMKNKHLSKAIQQQCFGEFRRQIEYKAIWNNIPVIIADRFYPSSKLCSCCGNIKKNLKLSDRIYKCECGNVIDRDYQAALNLKRYGELVLEKSVA